MKKLIPILLLFAYWSNAQDLKPTNTEAIIRLTITDMDGRPLETKFSLTGQKNTYHFQSNKSGIAVFKVKTGDDYRIKIPGSLTFYNYQVENFPGQELTAELKFDISQDLSDAATEDQALFVMSVLNLPTGTEVEIIDEKSIKTFKRSSAGEIKIALPLNANYRVRVKGVSIKDHLVKVNNTPYHVMYYVLYFTDNSSATLYKSNKQAFFNLRYINIYTKLPAAGEPLLLESKKTGKIYRSVTNPNGTCLFILPPNDTYSVHLTYARNILSKTIEGKDVLPIIEGHITYPGMKEMAACWKEDSLRIVMRDLEYKKKAISEIKEDKKRLKVEIENEASIARDKLEENPKYFEKDGNVVCSVIFRMKKNWASKMIVTDLTGSMYPYMKELLLWHSLNLMVNQDNDFVFFNDGDRKTDDQKIPGQTGGIYFTESDQSETVIDKMFETMNKGRGGDIPENDVEALLFAQGKMKKNAELILIADNYSPVRDISLVNQLKIPVRIILCGTGWGIHPDYIEIAYKTNGSIHTITEDLEMMSKLADGQRVTLMGHGYIFSNGKFFRDKK